MSAPPGDRDPRGVRARFLEHKGAPSLAAGLRATAVTTVPFLAGIFLARPELSWVAIAAWLVLVTDVGGAYATRAIAMSAAALAGTAVTFAGLLLGGSPWTAAPLLLVVGFAFMMLRTLGKGGETIGPIVVIFTAIAVGSPAASLEGALARAGCTLAGGALAIAVALALWRVHPYKPARHAVARCLEGLAARLEGEESPRRLRQDLEDARGVLVATRAVRAAESETGEQLHAVVDTVDEAGGAWIALEEAVARLDVVAGLDVVADLEPAPEAFARAVAALARELRVLARATQEGESPSARESVPELDPGPPGSLASGSLASDESAERRARLATAVTRLQELAALVARIRESVSGAERRRAAALASPATSPAVPSLPTRLRAALTPESRAFRHALRVGVVAALGASLAKGLGLENESWVTINAIVVVQPSLGETWIRLVQRIGGTVAGAALASLVVSRSGGAAWPSVLVVAVTTFVAAALRPVNYGYFVFFLTPAFLVMAELPTGRTDLALVRVGAAILGAATALLGTVLLWPRREHESLGHELALVVESQRELARLVLSSAHGGEVASDQTLQLARRKLGLATNNAEDALGRLLKEPNVPLALREMGFASTLRARRFSAALIALLPERARLGTDPALADAARRLDARLAADVSALEGKACVPTRDSALLGAGGGALAPVFERLQAYEASLGVVAAHAGEGSLRSSVSPPPSAA